MKCDRNLRFIFRTVLSYNCTPYMFCLYSRFASIQIPLILIVLNKSTSSTCSPNSTSSFTPSFLHLPRI